MADRVTGDSPPRFAHDSEAELARILDYYGVAWRYEPDVFPISWNADGAVIESFAPDFYLPEVDMYIELTTLLANGSGLSTAVAASASTP